MGQVSLIGAGLPRTATTSQKIGLEMLGFGPCYHMVEVLTDLELVPRWSEAVEGRVDWHRVFDGFSSTVDWPGAYFYRELMEVYPQAKILLSVRSGESWATSIIDTIWSVLYGDTILGNLSLAREKVDPGWRNYCEMMRTMWVKGGLFTSPEAGLDPAELARAMERYNEEVIATVPKDRLLVWTPSDGWDPLCSFLEVAVPESPFPRVNDAEQFTSMLAGGALNALNGWFEKQASSAQHGAAESAH
jgi:hypothetical protein